MSVITRAKLARYAVARSLFAPQTLMRAIDRLGYVQADPIRAPARAQDLILRHRVKNYCIDDLEKKYPKLDVAEDMLHNYGFFPNRHLSILYPRKLSPSWLAFNAAHKTLRRKVLNYLAENTHAHPREVEQALAMGKRVNGWGGSSSATTLMLESLHREGKARVVRRDAGIRVYGLVANPATTQMRTLSPTLTSALTPVQRADGIIRLIVNLYAPMPLRSLMQTINMMGSYKPNADYPKRIDAMVLSGELRREIVEGLIYIWPANENINCEPADDVRFLAPFDPIVWDRRRFEHLWEWAYRFEAYTPASKRKMGYYALPMLWGEAVIGWANVAIDNDKLKIVIGHAIKKPQGAAHVAFKNAVEAELERLRLFFRL